MTHIPPLGRYTKGGFTDQKTARKYTSPHHFKWENYEILNEPNLAKYMSATPGVPPCLLQMPFSHIEFITSLIHLP